MRLLFCTECAARVEVHEPQGEYIDPERYVCGDCQIAATDRLEAERGWVIGQPVPYDVIPY